MMIMEHNIIGLMNHKAHANSEYIGFCYMNEFQIPTEVDRKYLDNEEYIFEFDSELF